MENTCDNCGCYSENIVDYFALLCPDCKAKGYDINQLLQIATKATEREIEAMRNKRLNQPIVQTTIKQYGGI